MIIYEYGILRHCHEILLADWALVEMSATVKQIDKLTCSLFFVARTLVDKAMFVRIQTELDNSKLLTPQ